MDNNFLNKALNVLCGFSVILLGASLLLMLIVVVKLIVILI